MSIQRVVTAALRLQDELNRTSVPFCFIGGLAVERWGEPRLTVDADATVMSGFAHDRSIVDALLKRSAPAGPTLVNSRLIIESFCFGLERNRLDVSLGALPFEDRLIGRRLALEVPRRPSASNLFRRRSDRPQDVFGT